MIPRQIVCDASTGQPRWRFAGTAIYVDALVADFDQAVDVTAVRAAYRAMGLSDAEIDAGLDFDFPPVRPVAAVPELIAVTVHCECGLTYQTVVTGPGYQTDACPCGRIWQIGPTLAPTLIRGTVGGAAP